jgi:hypothetical protein
MTIFGIEAKQPEINPRDQTELLKTLPDPK